MEKISRISLALSLAFLLIVGILSTLCWFEAINSVSTGGKPQIIALALFICGVVVIGIGTYSWSKGVKNDVLLRSGERLQRADSIVIAAFFVVTILFGLCVLGSAAATLFPERALSMALKSLSWAMAGLSVGGAFGFLLGHPRRVAEEDRNPIARQGLQNLLRTGLDDIVDWLVKGLTTVLLVNAAKIFGYVDALSQIFARSVDGPNTLAYQEALAFIGPVIVSSTILGTLASCLVTRTYLTGALTRADRLTSGGFQTTGLELGEYVLLRSVEQSIQTDPTHVGTVVKNVAEKVATLSLDELKSASEFAIWAKSKAILGQPKDALEGYERAARFGECDPTILLDYSVALNSVSESDPQALVFLRKAKKHISEATDATVSKNIYKSLTYRLLYEEKKQDEVIRLCREYRQKKYKMSGGLWMNEACAWGQRFFALAEERDVFLKLDGKVKKPLEVPVAAFDKFPELKEARDRAFQAMKSALEKDANWKNNLRILLLSAGTAVDPKENDLYCFESMHEFRELLNLPPI